MVRTKVHFFGFSGPSNKFGRAQERFLNGPAPVGHVEHTFLKHFRTISWPKTGSSLAYGLILSELATKKVDWQQKLEYFLLGDLSYQMQPLNVDWGTAWPTLSNKKNPTSWSWINSILYVYVNFIVHSGMWQIHLVITCRTMGCARSFILGKSQHCRWLPSL